MIMHEAVKTGEAEGGEPRVQAPVGDQHRTDADGHRQ